MVSKSRGHGRSLLNPVTPPVGDPETDAQAMVIVAEVVEAADDIHTRGQGRLLLCRTAVTPREGSHALAKGGIEALDVSRIDDIATSRDL